MSAPESPAAQAMLDRWNAHHKWTRAYTQRLLDDFPLTMRKWLERYRKITLPSRVVQPGQWLYVNRKADFDTIHEKLVALPDDNARGSFILHDLLPP